MLKKLTVTAALVAISGTPFAGNALPRDVQAFVNNAEACEHLAGEWDSSLPLKDREEIEHNIDKYCGNAKRQLGVLKAKYKANSRMLETIDAHANDSVKSFVAERD
jgi:UDP-glucose 6-dehydrogenase